MDYLKYRKITAISALILGISVPTFSDYYRAKKDDIRYNSGLYEPSYDEYCLSEIAGQCIKPDDLPYSHYPEKNNISLRNKMVNVSGTATMDY